MKNEYIKAQMKLLNDRGEIITFPVYHLHSDYEANCEMLRTWSLSAYKRFKGKLGKVNVFYEYDDISDTDKALRDYSFIISVPYDEVC